MPREAKLYASSSGSVVRGFLEVPGEHPAPLDSKRENLAQAA
jgi:hypothetical protein